MLAEYLKTKSIKIRDHLPVPPSDRHLMMTMMLTMMMMMMMMTMTLLKWKLVFVDQRRALVQASNKERYFQLQVKCKIVRGFDGKGESPPSSEKCSPGRGARWVDIVLGKADPDKQIHSQHLYQKTFGILLVNWFALEDDFSSSSS